MTTNELRVLEIVWSWGGEASVDIIARGTGFSTNYARLLCQSLAREGCIDFLHSKLCKLKSKGKLAIIARRQSCQKIVVPAASGKFGLGKDNKGRLILSYG